MVALFPATPGANGSHGETSAKVETIDATSVILRAGDSTYTLTAPSPMSFGVELGDTVELSWEHHQPVFYAGPHSEVSLHARGRLAFSYTLDTDLPPGFSVERGAEQCTGESHCSRWVSEALIVRGPCGDTTEVPSGGKGRVCGYEVRPGNVRRTLERTGNQKTNCADWFELGTELTLIGPIEPRDDDAGTQDAGY